MAMNTINRGEMEKNSEKKRKKLGRAGKMGSWEQQETNEDSFYLK